jgi:ABC-2 type transport system permease protein
VSSTRAPGVPWLLVRLKVRLLRNRARTRSGGVFFLLASFAAAIVLGLLFATAAIDLVSDPDPRVVRTTFVLGASALTIGWTLLPLLTFGADESLDPARLILLPLQPRDLMRGLLVSALVGAAPLAALLVVLGATVGYLDVTWVVVPAALLLVALTVATARAVSTLLAARLTSRRGRDTTIILVSLLAFLIQGVRFIDLSFVGADDVDRVDSILRWWPPGMLGQAVVDAGNDRLGVALLQLVPAALLIPLLLRVWATALDRSLTTVNAETAVRRHAREDAALPLLDRLPFLRPTAWGAVAARELRYLWREPRHKVNLVNTILIGAGLPIFLAARSGGDLSDRTVLLATVAGYLVILSANNQFGMDGAATWLDVVAGDSMRALLVGKNVATAALVLPVITIAGLLTSALSGGWAFLPGAFVLGVAALGAGLATANVISVRFPQPLPDTRSPFGGSGGGQGCATGGIIVACTLVQGLLVLPVGVVGIVGLVAGPGWMTVLAPAAVVYGGALWWAGLTVAANFGRDHEPERIVAVDPARTRSRKA